ncbi:N-acetylmuramoyl-L-alanine amidase [Alteribacillus persepolensis]|uniref:N-acetylmuramoyl-L-alanine amidase n=1 Tax=Alteribacillus persepolensis TaxID=568899 RepID=A0A1G8GEG5_9BACI|nr:N-acetylmuramoyl-L-alanine amidase [Alteribacillus persepolensis]SDH92794.1 N-acetylmuramoyl-L-alanine amidase [Alteribacillus persepolensis]
MWKKPFYYMTIALAVVLLLPINNAEGFNDVSSDYWANEEITFLHEQGIVDGRPSGNYGPEENVSRAQAAKMMTNALPSQHPAPGTPTFTDVNTDFWAFHHIEEASALEVFTGKEDGRFDPNGDISRAQVAAVIGRAFFEEESVEAEQNLAYEDISSDFWASTYISALAEHHIIEEASYFRPNEKATRAELSAYLARAMQHQSDVPDYTEENNTPSSEDLDEKNIEFEGEVSVDGTLNARTGPGMEYETDTEFNDGTAIDIYETNGEWLKTEHNGKWVYVYHSYVTNTDEQNPDDTNTSTPPNQNNGNNEETIALGKSTVDDLNIRQQANADSEKVGTLNEDDIVEIYDYANEDWALVNYQGSKGYVHRYYLLEKDPEKNSLAEQTIVIDAGHGGHDSGAVGNGLIEKEVVLDVSLEVEERLQDAGVDVVMTRRDDTFLELNERVQIAENENADSFVSIHANAASPTAEGAETFYHTNYEAKESEALAASIQKELVEQTEMSDRRVAAGNFFVIRNTTMPSTLIELGFLTNTQDASRMKQTNYEEIAADAVYDGIVNYYEW